MNAKLLIGCRAFANGRGEAIELAGCRAHMWRKFYEAIEPSPRTAQVDRFPPFWRPSMMEVIVGAAASVK
jgi:hypothetical protein